MCSLPIVNASEFEFWKGLRTKKPCTGRGGACSPPAICVCCVGDVGEGGMYVLDFAVVLSLSAVILSLSAVVLSLRRCPLSPPSSSLCRRPFSPPSSSVCPPSSSLSPPSSSLSPPSSSLSLSTSCCPPLPPKVTTLTCNFQSAITVIISV
ncbi:hypothetical protein CPB84DRAFT_1383252 [Gymnopilus junonius]|uniref:Uncharacterized protein n=1 Tax=Gymnopilus junonius TaxID=109634 RepID=A0A9P5TK65_GYMJU|nr:hypothetical protein CPB84DRAFT_1383252 [Gymnopilus junonius]